MWELQNESVVVVETVLNSIIYAVVSQSEKYLLKKLMEEIVNNQLCTLIKLSEWKCLLEKNTSFYDKHIASNNIIDTAVSTCSQSSNHLWIELRKYRISASTRAHRIYEPKTMML